MENLNWIDLTILGILLSSVLLGAWRGFFAVVFGVLSLIIGFFVAQKYAPGLIPGLSLLLGTSALLEPLAYLLTFFIGFSVFGVLTFIIRRMFRKINLGGIDALIGGLFGVLRGWLFAVLVTLLLSLANMHQTKVWHDAVTIPVIGTSLRVTMGLPFLSDYQQWLIYDEKNRPLLSFDRVWAVEQKVEADASMNQRDVDIDSLTREIVKYSAVGGDKAASQIAIERYEGERIDTPLQILSDVMERLNCQIRGEKNCRGDSDSRRPSSSPQRNAMQQIEEDTAVKRRNDDLDLVTGELAEQSGGGSDDTNSESVGISPSVLSELKEYLNCEINEGKYCDGKISGGNER